jgi:hypothetical protein
MGAAVGGLAARAALERRSAICVESWRCWCLSRLPADAAERSAGEVAGTAEEVGAGLAAVRRRKWW